MEYEMLKQMIEELEVEAYSLKNINEDLVWAKFLTILAQIKILCTLQSRIDKARESDIIAMSSEGCI